MGDSAELSRRAKVEKALAERGYSVGPDGELPGIPCEACGAEAITLNDDGWKAACGSCGERFDALEVAMGQTRKSTGAAQAMSEAHREEAGAVPAPDISPPAENRVEQLEDPSPTPVRPEHKSSFGEHLIITLLSLVFLFAGLMAAAMSGFANYQAFGAMVDDPMQSRVWAWTGVIASVCSFGGFTLVYWHGAARRFKEAIRAAVFALAGAATSLVGTQMYMANTERSRLAQSETAGAQIPILEAQIADWQSELQGIDPAVRSVEGLEAYIAEVERVGRTNERPYRAALDELGQARRRDELTSRIETARGDLADLAGAAVPASQSAGSPLQSWFFAAMLEVFSSQGTSIGFVALLILAGRRGGSGD